MQIWTKQFYFGAIAVVAYFVLNDFKVDADNEAEIYLDELFRGRSPSDWQAIWHTETHSRCRDKLKIHMYWACEKDIYRMTRRNGKRTDESINKRSHSIVPTWLNPDCAQTLLRTRRLNDKFVTHECCTKVGCTWEEYGEYCSANKRRNHN